MEQILVFLSGAAIVIAYFYFIHGTLCGPVRPNRATWLVWFVQDDLMAASALMAGVGPAAVMPVVWGSGAGIMFYIAHTRGTRKPFTPTELACMYLSALGIALWATVGSPILALVASVSSSCIAGIPTITKAWVDPKSEPLAGWLLMLTGTVFSAIAIQAWTFESGLIPIACGALQAGIVMLLTPYAIKKYFVK